MTDQQQPTSTEATIKRFFKSLTFRTFIPSFRTILLTLILLMSVVNFAFLLNHETSEKFDSNEQMTLLSTAVSVQSLSKNCNDPTKVVYGLKVIDRQMTILNFYDYPRYEKLLSHIIELEDQYMADGIPSNVDCNMALEEIYTELTVHIRHFALLQHKYDRYKTPDPEGSVQLQGNSQ